MAKEFDVIFCPSPESLKKTYKILYYEPNWANKETVNLAALQVVLANTFSYSPLSRKHLCGAKFVHVVALEYQIEE